MNKDLSAVLHTDRVRLGRAASAHGSGAAGPPAEVSAVVLARYRALAPHLYGGVSLKAAAADAGVPYREVHELVYRREAAAPND